MKSITTIVYVVKIGLYHVLTSTLYLFHINYFYFNLQATYLDASSFYDTNTTMTPPTLPGNRIICR
jgi:hypothetical protein